MNDEKRKKILESLEQMGSLDIKDWEDLLNCLVLAHKAIVNSITVLTENSDSSLEVIYEIEEQLKKHKVLFTSVKENKDE